MNQALAETCLRYLDGDLAADELQAFNRLLVESAEAADLLSQLAMDEQHYRVNPPEAEEDLLPALLKLEASAQPLSQGNALMDDVDERVERSADSYRSTLKVLGDMGFWGYLGRSAMRSKPGRWVAVAAVVALAATLVFVFTGGPSNTPQGPDIAGTPSEPDSDTPAPNPTNNPTVATLTATHNAQWGNTPAERALARGFKLQAGTRLTLTAGFAEITTHDGAVAILEAPATIELLNNDNALRLHAGKLVGICETDSSKGFLVRTPHMDVIDLGTRFGVDASRFNVTEVHVFEGVVEVALSDAAGSGQAIRQRLSKGQAVRAAVGSEKLAAIELDTSLMATPQTPAGPTLMMTGAGLMKGQFDPGWSVVAVDGQPVVADTEMWADTDTKLGSYGDTVPMFLKINELLFPADQKSAVFTCRSSFEVPQAFDPTVQRLVLHVEGDHSIKAVRIDGQPIDVPRNRTKLIELPIEQALSPGSHTIEIDVQEVKTNKAFRAGLRAMIEIEQPATQPNIDRQP